MLNILLLWVSLFAKSDVNFGFYEKNSSEIPTAVHAAKTKIFKITMPYYIHVNAERYDAVIAHLGNSEDIRREVQICKDANEESCIVRYSEINGTAFLDKTPDAIWTNCHIVTQWMQYAARKRNFTKTKEVFDYFSGLEMPLTLTDSENKNIYSATEKSILKVFVPLVSFPHVLSACDTIDDLVKIKLARPLADDGLRWNKTSSALRMYLGGFPRATTSRAAMGKMDSDGSQFYWTLGDFLDFKSEVGSSYMQQKEHSSLVTSGTYMQGLLSDGVEGMSGSPVLNEMGEVMGIYKGFVPLDEDHKDIPFISLFITTEGMRYAEIFSGE